MIRLLLRIFKITDYEVCQSCSTLKEQLKYERDEKAKLTETLLNILSPKVVESAPVILESFQPAAGTFARRRAALEAKDREEARIKSQSPNLGKPDSLRNINELEKELGIEEKRGLRMANVPPATVTVTSTTGPGQAVTAQVIRNVVNFSVDFVANTMRIQSSGANGLQYFDYSAMATLTWTISGGLTSVTVSS